MLPEFAVNRAVKDGRLVYVAVPELECDVDVFLFWKAGRTSKAITSFARFVVEKELPGIRLAVKEEIADSR